MLVLGGSSGLLTLMSLTDDASSYTQSLPRPPHGPASLHQCHGDIHVLFTQVPFGGAWSTLLCEVDWVKNAENAMKRNVQLMNGTKRNAQKFFRGIHEAILCFPKFSTQMFVGGESNPLLSVGLLVAPHFAFYVALFNIFCLCLMIASLHVLTLDCINLGRQAQIIPTWK